jgi:hypothetical protein
MLKALATDEWFISSEKSMESVIVDVQNPNRILSQNGKEIMRIGQRIMDAKTKTIYRVTRMEEDLIVLTAEDESDELVIRNDKSQDLR